MALVLFPDVEAWAVSYLRDQLASWPDAYASGVVVSTRVPSTRAARMVVVRRDGGPRRTQVTEVARLTVLVWAETDPDVTDLTNLVRALLAAAPNNGPVRASTEVGGPVQEIEESGQPLRAVTVELVVRGTASA